MAGNTKVNVFGKKRKAPRVSKSSAKTPKGMRSKPGVLAKVKADAGPSRVAPEQLKRAVTALVDYFQRERDARKKQSLIDEAEHISLIVTLFKTPTQGKNKGIPIPIPHTLHPVDETRLCIIVKDDAVKPVKAKLEGQLHMGVDKVLSLTKLRTRFADHQKKRELCGSYDLFLADDRILPMLTKALGREFFKHKKQPRPIKVLRKNLEGQISKARDSTRLYLGWGNCSAVRIARTDMSTAEIIANLSQGIQHVAQAVPRGWKGIQALHIKTPDSVALPLYSKAPEVQALLRAASSSGDQQVVPADSNNSGKKSKAAAAKKSSKKSAKSGTAASPTKRRRAARGKAEAEEVAAEEEEVAEAEAEAEEDVEAEEEQDKEEEEAPKPKRKRVAVKASRTPAASKAASKFSPRVTRSMRKKRGGK